MIHLTLIGVGSTRERMLCQATPVLSDRFWHAMYASPTLLAQPDICPACLAVWTAEEADNASPGPSPEASLAPAQETA